MTNGIRAGLGGAVLTFVLASCGGLSSGGDLYIDPSSLTLSSGYGVQNATYNGGSYSGPAICDNTTTPMNASFSYSGTISTVDVRLKGGTTGNVSGNIRNVTVSDSGSSVSLGFTVGAGVAPLNVGPQSIIVVPNAHVIGLTRLEMVGHSPKGSTDVLPSNFIPVVDNC